MEPMVTDLSAVRICTPLCTVKESPSADAKASSELLFGESVQVLREEKGWLKVRATADGYEGFVESNACHSTDHAATHWVTARATLVFEQPDIKSPVVHRVLFGSPLSLSDCDVDDKFMHLSDVGFIWANHCKKSSDVLSASLIDIAEQYYMGAPYLWGGRSSDGCDCSGLVQMLAAAKGIKIPRDSGEQENALPDDVEFKDRAAN